MNSSAFCVMWAEAKLACLALPFVDFQRMFNHELAPSVFPSGALVLEYISPQSRATFGWELSLFDIGQGISLSVGLARIQQ